MIGYKDKSFCIKKDCKHFKSCPDAFNETTKAGVIRWWGSKDGPISITEGEWKCYEQS